MEIKRTGAAEYGRYIKALICGDPGAGKTLISSTFPNPMFATPEGLLMSVAGRDVPFVKINTVEDLYELKKTVLDLPFRERTEMLGYPVETIVIDTIDEIQKMLVRERLAETRKAALELKDWGWLGEQMRSITRGLRNLDMNVVLTCHLKKDKDEESGRVSFAPSIQGAFGDEIAGYVDLALFLKTRSVLKTVDGEARRVIERVLQTYQDANHPWVKDHSGKLPQEIKVNFQDDFDRMHKIIYGEIGEAIDAMRERLGAVSAPESEAEPDTAEPVVEAPAAAPEAEIGPVTDVSADAAVQLVDETVDSTEPEADETAPTPKFTCSTCGTGFDDEDQAELSQIKTRGDTLCKPCHKARFDKK